MPPTAFRKAANSTQGVRRTQAQTLLVRFHVTQFSSLPPYSKKRRNHFLSPRFSLCQPIAKSLAPVAPDPHRLTPELRRAPRTAFNLIFRKLDEKHSIGAPSPMTC